jgi:regulator of replication initiation timing
MANYRYTYESGGRRYEIDAPKGSTAADLQAIVDGSGRMAAPLPPAAPKPKPKKKEEESFLSGVIPTLQSATGKVISTSGELMQQFAPILGRLNNAGAPGIALAGVLGREYGKGITASGEAKLPEASLADRRRQQAEITGATPDIYSKALSVFGRAAAANPTVGRLAQEFLPQTPVEAARTIATVKAPFQTARGASEFVASQIPASLIPLGGGKAVQLARGAFLPVAGREAAKAALAKEIGVGVATTGGVINAASAGSQAYDDVLAKGGTQEEADRAFKIAALGAGAVSGAASRMTGLEQLAFAEKPARGGILRSAGRAVIGEAPQEFVEEGGATLATNVAKLGTAAEVPIGEDVLSSGALGAIGGGIIAAPIGGLQGLANRGAADDDTPAAPRAPRTPPRAPPPPADMGALTQALGPVGGKITLNEPSGPRDYTFEGFDEDGGVVLADADGVVFSEDPAQVQAAIKAGVAAPASGLGGMAFGMDITEGLSDVVAPPPPPPPPPPPTPTAEYVPPAPKPKLIIETAEEEATRKAEQAVRDAQRREAAAREPAPAPSAFFPGTYKPKLIIEAEPTTILPIEEDVASYMQEYAATRTPSQMTQVEDSARQIATERGATSVSKQDMLQAGMAFDNALFKATPDEAPEKVAIAPYRPDKREPAVVWDKFNKSFEGQDFPNVSWALGSDWGMGRGVPTKASYRRDAEARMESLYGPRPEAVQEPVQPAPVAEAPSPRNTQKQSKVGNVIFDQENGVGQVPLNQNVKYRGFTAMMRPSKFLELAADIDKPKQSSLNFIRDSIDEGRGVGSPFLSLDFKTGKIKGHDGRHRMMVIQEKNGDEPVPVHIFGEGEGRARSLNEGKINAFASNLTSERGNQSSDNFSEAFLEDAVVPVTPAAPPPAAARAVGKSGRATIPATREKVDVQYELQDLENIRFAEGDLQNRDRSRPQTQQFLSRFTSTFDPDGLGEDPSTDRGAPVINKDNTILSGNGRTLGLEEIYENYPEQAEAYRQFLREQGYDIEGVERPVLVRRLMSDVDERKFVVGSNEPDIAALSPPEQAAQDAKDILTPGVFAKFKGGDLNAAKNDAFVSAFLAEMSQQQRENAMDDKGKVSSQALKRIENALLYKAYGGTGRASKIFISKAMERNDDDTKTLTNSLVDVSKDWIGFQQAIEAGEVDKKYDITGKLMETIGTASDIKASGNSVAFELRSPDMVEPMDPFVREILLAFHNDDVSRILSRKAIAEKLKAYTEVAAVQQAEPDMLGMSETPSARDIWRRIDKGEGAPQSDLYASVEEPRDVSQQDIEEIRKVPSLKRGLAKLIKYKDDQLIDDAEFAKQVADLKDYVDYMQEAKNYRLSKKGRVRGGDRVLSEMLKARRAGNIDPDSVDFAMWALKGNPSLADGLAISILTPKEKSPAGDYEPVTRVMTLFKGRASDTTAVHELLHHTERMMPADIQDAIRATWLREFNKQEKKAKSGTFEKAYFRALRAFHSGEQITVGKENFPSKKGLDIAFNLIRKGYVPYSYYQYVNPSEFWAVNATEIMQKRFDVSESILGRLRNWLSEFVERAKGLFNLSAKSPLLKALDSLAKADGKFNSQEMLSDEDTRYMDITPLDEKRTEKKLKELESILGDLDKAMKDEAFGIPQMQRQIVSALDNALNNLDDIADNAPAEFNDRIDDLEIKIADLKAIAGASLKPANENKLETEVQKADRELEVARQALDKAFDDDRAYMDRRTKDRKAYDKEYDQLEKIYDEAFAKWDKLYREESAAIMMALTNGTPDQMRNAVAKAQKPDDKINGEGADLQKKNRGCD